MRRAGRAHYRDLAHPERAHAVRRTARAERRVHGRRRRALEPAASGGDQAHHHRVGAGALHFVDKAAHEAPRIVGVRVDPDQPAPAGRVQARGAIDPRALVTGRIGHQPHARIAGRVGPDDLAASVRAAAVGDDDDRILILEIRKKVIEQRRQVRRFVQTGHGEEGARGAISGRWQGHR